ncbi:MAG TPA: pitrilysin family protein [Sphingomicrobium sp.]|nr:pitrilysin family protein [Sphingomicrobium sp.]
MGRSVLGDEQSIAAIRAEDLQRWLHQHYAPNRLILVAAGKVEHERLVDLAEAAFGDMERSSDVLAEPAEFIGGIRFERRRGDQAHVAIAMSAPRWDADDEYASQLFADVVGAGASSRLFQQLREEQGLAYSVSAATQNFSDCGIFWTYVAARRGDARLAQSEIERVLAETVATLEPREVERARALAKAGMMMSLESCWGQASYVATRLLREGELVEPAEIIRRLDAVSLDEVRAAGSRMISGPRALACVGAKLALAA